MTRFSKYDDQKAGLDGTVAAGEAALEQKPKLEQVPEGVVYENASAKAEGGGRGLNPIFEFFTRRGK